MQETNVVVVVEVDKGQVRDIQEVPPKTFTTPLPSQRTQQANTKYQDIDTALMQKRRRFSIKYIAGNHHPRL